MSGKKNSRAALRTFSKTTDTGGAESSIGVNKGNLNAEHR